MEYFVLTVAVVVAALVWRRIALARRAEAWEEAQRESYRQRIAQDPKNAAAYEYLGDSLRRAGRLSEARDVYLQALDAGGDPQSDERTRYKLKQMDLDIRAAAQARGRRGPAPAPEAAFCRHCGAPNPPRRRFCEICHARMPFHSFGEALRDKELQRASLEGVTMIAVMLIVLHICSFLPIDIQGLLLISTVIVVAWRFLQALEGHRR